MEYNMIIQLLVLISMTKVVSMQEAITPVDGSPLLPALLQSLSRQKYSPKTASTISNEYDYIIVGGGASGSVIASRLSEEPCVTVLLLEAGPEPPILTEVPALYLYFAGTNVDWKYRTVPQKYTASGIVTRQLPLVAGKMLGGSASLNGMLFVRGNKEDYDNWAKLGAKGWSYQEIFRYFLKLEDNRTPAFAINGYHATGGPITMEQPRYQPTVKQSASAAAVNMGYKFVDSNGAQQTGFYNLQANIRSNQRCSPVKGYLVPVDKRNNLDISVNSFVTKVIFKNGQATGIEFFKEKYQQIKVRREVIITAGTLNTPKILMLSGVGPKEILDKLHIPVVADLPVGKNFHDHCGTGYFFTLPPNVPPLRERLSNSNTIKQYIENRSGPLAQAASLLLAFLNGNNTTTSFDFPNFQMSLTELDNTFMKFSGLRPEIYKGFFAPYENRAIFQCLSQSLRVRSRGTITINSTVPYDPPLIDPNYLKDPMDLQDMVDGLKFCRKLVTSKEMRGIGAMPFQTVMPGCEEYYYNNEDEYFKCYSRTLINSYLHFVGTAKMGDPSDQTTVLDPELRVKGVKGLRVSDASVIPQIPSGNIHIPVVMIAEKASDMIKSSIRCARPIQYPKIFPQSGFASAFATIK